MSPIHLPSTSFIATTAIHRRHELISSSVKKFAIGRLLAQLPIRIIRVEKDTFILVDDVLALFQRVVMEPLPPKDDKGSQNRTNVSMIVMAAQGMIAARNLSDERVSY
ncbi:hypothetical protein Tco_1150310 [Tanacetum coccineum]